MPILMFMGGNQMSQFQVKYFDEDDWQGVSETFVLEKLVDNFDRLTPVLSELVQGKEIITPKGIFRKKNCGNEGKDY